MIMARRDWSVGGKDAGFSHSFKVPRGLFILLPFSQKLKHQETGMAFVHMVFFDLCVTQFPQHLYSADPQNDLRGKPIFLITSIKVVGKSSIIIAVFLQIRIQEDDGQGTSGYPNDIVLPSLYPYGSTLNLYIGLFS